MKLKLAILTAALTFGTQAFGALTVDCLDDDSKLSVVVEHSYEAGQKDYEQAAKYTVYDNDGLELVVGTFNQVMMGADEFLNTTVFGFMAESAVIGVAASEVSIPSLSEMKPGKYAAKGDVFVLISAEKGEMLEGSSLNCTIELK